ncbi:acetoacetate--CoA ligase [Arundinibacter roseus]|uniref:Acetoacetate--CoA ligase n=2 Tax=Arundinibacter roseus TaxID=2070510 RepID=A0A4V2X9F2_9BACT|nr:acetoacetate--CoA ligase [Arundinibacter roseus]
MPSTPLWKPGRALMEQSVLKKYMDWLFVKKGLFFRSYHDLWEWSVTDVEDFWESLWHFFQIKSHDTYFTVMERTEADMLHTRWFSRATLNYAEHIFRHKTRDRPALVFQSERHSLQEISWDTLEKQVAAVSTWLRRRGVKRGDRVAAVLPNIPQAVVAFLATQSVGAVWSSCSPDFGEASILDRFFQIEPKVLLMADSYQYNGRTFDKISDFQKLIKKLPSVELSVLVPYLDKDASLDGTVSWEDILHSPTTALDFEPLPFDHPLWILYSSGTTGAPKAITHSVGGCLLEHLKALTFHQNVKPGDRYFWYSTTGWMMWNYSLASLLTGATLVLYDGAPAFPTLQVLWTFAEKARINHFGGGAAYFIACRKANLSVPTERLKHLQTIGSTGSPLTAEAYEWIYEHISRDVWLISLSGGTDVCSAFVGGCPLLPVYAGEIQCRMLGCKLEAYSEEGTPVSNQVGEMVILQPMPSMPIYFWNDPDDQRYRNSYFETYPGVWRHGDWIKITPRGSVIIFGRSDATLNRGGVRIGTAEIYSALEKIPEIKDSLVVYLEQEDGSGDMPLFVVLAQPGNLTTELKTQINDTLRSQFSPRHVPDRIEEVLDVPYTISGKKLETPIKKILMGQLPERVVSRDTLRNPEAIDIFATMAAKKSVL